MVFIRFCARADRADVPEVLDPSRRRFMDGMAASLGQRDSKSQAGPAAEQRRFDEALHQHASVG
jgi:hypothetical protein